MAKNQNKTVAKELLERGEAELKSLLATKHDELHKVEMKRALGQLRTTHQLKDLKRDVARINTVLTQKSQKAKQGSRA